MTADGQCPDTPDTCGGLVRTGPDIGESVDCGPLPARADTVRTAPDTRLADTGEVVRFAYYATVPRHLAGTALAEALTHLTQATTPPPPPRKESPT